MGKIVFPDDLIAYAEKSAAAGGMDLYLTVVAAAGDSLNAANPPPSPNEKAAICCVVDQVMRRFDQATFPGFMQDIRAEDIVGISFRVLLSFRDLLGPVRFDEICDEIDKRHRRDRHH